MFWDFSNICQLIYSLILLKCFEYICFEYMYLNTKHKDLYYYILIYLLFTLFMGRKNLHLRCISSQDSLFKWKMIMTLCSFVLLTFVLLGLSNDILDVNTLLMRSCTIDKIINMNETLIRVNSFHFLVLFFSFSDYICITWNLIFVSCLDHTIPCIFRIVLIKFHTRSQIYFNLVSVKF